MLEKRGIVVAINDKFTIVQTMRESYCTQCANKSCGTGSLATMLGQKYTEVKVPNYVGAKMGDRVVIGLEELSLLKSALTLYLFPLLGMFVGAIGYDRLAMIAQWPNSEIITALAGFLGLIIAWVWAKQVIAKMSENTHYQPIILKTEL